MKCPDCGKEGKYILIEQVDPYKDGIVKCSYCNNTIAHFVYNEAH
jgi:hypothetical protein